jgi:hypothetical protein
MTTVLNPVVFKRKNKSTSAAILDSKTLFSQLLLVAIGLVKPHMPRSAATLSSSMPLQLIVWSTLPPEVPDLEERLGPTKME